MLTWMNLPNPSPTAMIPPSEVLVKSTAEA